MAGGQGGGAAPPGEPLHPHEPRQLGPYRLLSRLGMGGMGAVYFAHDPTGRPVAVKVIRPELAADEEFRRRFRQEVEAARRVAPFCTAEVLDADPDAPSPYLVTEFIDGIRLDQAVEGGPLGSSTLTGLAVGVATALTAIHQAGLVHRDLKPSNVMLSLSGPRVIDFGIAQALEGSAEGGLTGSKARPTAWGFGSAGWMAPEQINGLPIGPEADVFTWGILVAYAATGRHPFGPGTDMEISSRIVGAEPDLSGLPEDLRAIVAAALAKDPNARPSARDLLLRLIALPPAPSSAPEGSRGGRGAPAAVDQAHQLLSLTGGPGVPGLAPTRVGPPTSLSGRAAAPWPAGQAAPVPGQHPSASRYPSPGQPLPPRRPLPPAGPWPPNPPRRPRNTKRLLGIAGVALVGIIAILLALSALTGNDDPSTGTGSSPSASPGPTAQPSAEPGVGVPVRDGQLEFVVESYECGVDQVGQGWLALRPSGQFCLVRVRAANVGNSTRLLVHSSLYLRDDSGDRHSASFLARFHLPGETIWNAVDPGETVEGTLVFDIPRDAGPAEVELHDSPFSNGVTVPL